VAAAPSKWISNRRLNSLTAIAQPINQHAHGPRTVRHLGLKIKGAVHAGVLPAHRSDREAPEAEFQARIGISRGVSR
jgi:hypothetical protein